MRYNCVCVPDRWRGRGRALPRPAGCAPAAQARFVRWRPTHPSILPVLPMLFVRVVASGQLRGGARATFRLARPATPLTSRSCAARQHHAPNGLDSNGVERLGRGSSRWRRGATDYEGQGRHLTSAWSWRAPEAAVHLRLCARPLPRSGRALARPARCAPAAQARFVRQHTTVAMTQFDARDRHPTVIWL